MVKTESRDVSLVAGHVEGVLQLILHGRFMSVRLCPMYLLTYPTGPVKDGCSHKTRVQAAALLCAPETHGPSAECAE